jgi:hypothetical protein
LILAGLAVLAVLLALLVLNAVQNPVSRRYANAEAVLEQVSSAPLDLHTTPDLPYSEIRRTILAKPKLWQALVDAPPPTPNVPNLAKMLQGVTVTRDQIGVSEDMKVRIRGAEGNTRGQWVGKGDVVNGLSVKAITDRAIVFSTVSDGVEYTHEMPRPGR